MREDFLIGCFRAAAAPGYNGFFSRPRAVTVKPIPLFRVFMSPREQLLPALERVLYSGQISEGAEVESFEREFGEFIGNPQVLSFYSGTAALHAALILAGVKRGDEVISTAMTAEPTNLAILHAGATPVWADVERRNGNIDPDSVAERITSATRAIVAVHYGGIPVAIARLREVAERRGIPVIEDAAHALGARYGNVPLGTHSEYVMFSFQAIKHLTRSTAACSPCAGRRMSRAGRRVRWFGMDRKALRTEVDVREVGYKYHMNNVNAVIGSVQLGHIAPVLARHVANGKYFDRALGGIPGSSFSHGTRRRNLPIGSTPCLPKIAMRSRGAWTSTA